MLKFYNDTNHTEIDIATGIKIYVKSFENKDIKKNMIFQIKTRTRNNDCVYRTLLESVGQS